MRTHHADPWLLLMFLLGGVTLLLACQAFSAALHSGVTTALSIPR